MRRSRLPRSLGSAALVGSLLLAWVSPARADEPAERAAREAYAEAAAAFDRGDFAAAAAGFARADELVPNAVTLETALRAAIEADLPALGMELADRASARAPEGELLARMDEARKKLAGRAARVLVRCPTACRVKLDGKPIAAEAPRWVAAGEHAIEIDRDGAIERRAVRAVAGQVVEIAAASAPPPPVAAPPSPPPPKPIAAPIAPPEAPPARGISPVWFGLGAGATAVLGAVTIGLGVDTAKKHAAFVEQPSAAAQSAGQAAQARTNVMIGVTSAAALATTAIGIFAVRWSPGPRAAELHLGPSYALFRGRF